MSDELGSRPDHDVALKPAGTGLLLARGVEEGIPWAVCSTSAPDVDVTHMPRGALEKHREQASYGYIKLPPGHPWFSDPRYNQEPLPIHGGVVAYVDEASGWIGFATDGALDLWANTPARKRRRIAHRPDIRRWSESEVIGEARRTAARAAQAMKPISGA